MALWNGAYESRIIDVAPSRVRKIKRRAKRPQAWSLAQLDSLLKTCERLQGNMKRGCDVERRTFWKAWIMLGYYTGLRLGDLLALRWDSLSPDGILTVVQAKTGDLIACQLPPDLLTTLEKLHGGGRERVFGDCLNRRNLLEFFRRIVAAAGLTGTTKWLRRSGASNLEAVERGAAPAFLGHRSDISLARAHYIDPVIARSLKPMPPKIG